MSGSPEPGVPGTGVVREVSLLSGVHRLEARLHAPAGPPRAAIVVAHPHPAHGGHMDHAVVVLVAECAARAGMLALRFDFRGVRQSEGEVEDFEGHLEDWRVALADVSRRVPGVPALGAGFSYGARSMAWIARSGAPRRLDLAGRLLLAPATRVPRTRRDFGALLLGRPLVDATLDPHVLANLAALPDPTEVLVGEHDVVAPPGELRAHLAPGARLTVLAGLNHFFHRGVGAGAPDAALASAVEAALARLLRNGR